MRHVNSFILPRVLCLVAILALLWWGGGHPGVWTREALPLLFGRSSSPTWGADLPSVQVYGELTTVSWSGVTTYAGLIAPTQRIQRQSLTITTSAGEDLTQDQRARREALEELWRTRPTTWPRDRWPDGTLEQSPTTQRQDSYPAGVLATVGVGVLVVMILLLTILAARSKSRTG